MKYSYGTYSNFAKENVRDVYNNYRYPYSYYWQYISLNLWVQLWKDLKIKNAGD
jgi:hypothetical protein